MQQEKIQLLLENYYNATQIEAIYFDRKMNAFSYYNNNGVLDDLHYISSGKIEHYINEVFNGRQNTQGKFYTYYLCHNIACNIVFLQFGEEPLGAVVTQPTALSPITKEYLEQKSHSLPSAQQVEYISALMRAPVVPNSRIAPIGKVLSALAFSIFNETDLQQVLSDGKDLPPAYEFFRPGSLSPQSQNSFSASRHGGLPIYLKIKEAVTKGDVELLLRAVEAFDFGSISFDSHRSKDDMRSIKNGFIQGCSMCSFIAIEAGVPYNKVRELTEGVIREIESAESISTMYELLKSSLIYLTRAVSVTHIIGYSKPVRMVMEYIDNNYSEKITLKMLAKHVNLSEFYLSNLIKKETGSNITDIINRVRINESKKILLTSPISVAELAVMVGFTYSNHFSRVFKQYTGMTPSAFLKSVSSSHDDSHSKEIPRMLLDHLNQALTLFSGIFDVGRIVDPSLNLTWMMKPDGEMSQSTCYNFWHKNQSCKTCVTSKALSENRPFVKLEQSTEGKFFVFAAPVAVGKRKYVVELMKCVTDNYFDCTK